MLKSESLPPLTRAINFMQPINKEVTKAALKEVIGKCFPRIRFAVAYGSAVFQQANVKPSGNSMVDLLLVVNSRSQFHK